MWILTNHPLFMQHSRFDYDRCASTNASCLGQCFIGLSGRNIIIVIQDPSAQVSHFLPNVVYYLTSKIIYPYMQGIVRTD